MLDLGDRLVTWVNDVKEYALSEALKGRTWEGWKLVEGRSNRKFTDEKIVADVVETAGYDPYEKKVVGITEMTRRLGRDKFNELLEAFITKPPGKPTLVHTIDKRPAMTTAANDFKED